MNFGSTRTRLALTIAAGVVALGSPAHSAGNVPQDSGVWDSGTAKVVCGTGTLRRTCTYTFTSTNCTEAYVNGQNVLPCKATVTVVAQIVPIFNGAGQNIGCTSIALDEANSGRVVYDSFFDRYDRTIPLDYKQIHVRDVFSDGSPGEITYGGSTSDQVLTWVTEGHFQQTCARAANRTSTNTGTAHGFVQVFTGPAVA